MTLKELFKEFGHDAKWQRFAIASTQSMIFILRKIGDKEIDKLSRFDFEFELESGEHPIERKVKARACLTHMLRWGKRQGMNVCTLDNKN